MSKPNWNYFLALEDDLDGLARFVEFAPANYDTYSIEMARLLMAATQEIDVLFKQICDLKGGAADNEQGYRGFIPGVYPNLVTAKIEVARFDLSFVPFADWATSTTPSWWTANNKVKHERHTHFPKASPKNVLNAVRELLVANLYFHDASGTIEDLFPGTTHLIPPDMVKGIMPTHFGMVPKYKVL